MGTADPLQTASSRKHAAIPARAPPRTYPRRWPRNGPPVPGLARGGAGWALGAALAQLRALAGRPRPPSGPETPSSGAPQLPRAGGP